ncbi:MAG: dihydrodipicolinate synthase family protein [Alphaproteobacteria bacterium]
MALARENAEATRPAARLRTVPAGILQSPVTPMTADGAVDYGTFEKLLDFHVGQGKPGTVGITMNLHIAESLNLTTEERKGLAETAVRAVGGRVPVIVNVSTPGTDAAIDLARHAERIGADGVIVIAPYYWKPAPAALYEHFAAVMGAVDIAVMAYNSPALQDGVSISPDMLTRLIERFDNFIGLKEASHNFEMFIELRAAARRARPDFALMLGVEYLLPSMTMGGKGSLAAMGGIAPRLTARLYEAVKAGKLEDAQVMQETCSALYQICKVAYPAPIKAAMELLGRPVGPTRLPIPTLDKAGREKLRGQLQALGLLDTEPHGW